MALIIPSRAWHQRALRWVAVLAGVSACAPLGMTLPYDEAPPTPEGGRIKPTLGWLATRPGETTNGAPDGSIDIEVVHIDGRTLLQQVRHYRIGDQAYGDSILLDRSSLRPFETVRWTPQGTYIARYNHRQVDRTFYPARGGSSRSTETLDVEPYSALGMEVIVASLPLGEGYHSMLPVVIDTTARGWSWMHVEVQREVSLRERPDQPERDTWIVDCDVGATRTRLWIATDGRTVRKIEQLGPDNVVRSVIRRMLLTLPANVKPGE